MAIDNVNVIDGMALNKDNNAIVLLLTDHLSWDGEKALSEFDHLNLLQDKINAYISYLESGQYAETYSTEEIDFAVIEIHFKYAVTENCEKYLNAVQNQIGQLGIKIEAVIDDR